MESILVEQSTLGEAEIVPLLYSVLQVRSLLFKYLYDKYVFTIASLQFDGSISQTFSGFAPNVSNGYTASPSNPRITLSSSGELRHTVLVPEDTGTYRFTSPDLGGATLVINVFVYGMCTYTCCLMRIALLQVLLTLSASVVHKQLMQAKE